MNEGGGLLKVEEIKTIGVVGAGLMGHGIAQIFALKGFTVKLFDNDPKVLESAPAKIRNNLQTLSELHLVESSEVAHCLGPSPALQESARNVSRG